MNDLNLEFESRDKQTCAFLFTQEAVRFLGTRVVDQVVFFRFAPNNKCLDLVNSFYFRKAPPVQPKDLLDAVDTYRNIIFECRGRADGYEGESV